VPGASTTQQLPDAKLITAIIDAMSKADLRKYEAWTALSELSSDTTVDNIYVDPAGIIVSGNKFSGLAEISVALKYHSDSDRDLETSDGFEGQFEGHFERRRPVIDKVTVDTRAFYA
jgi:hypothetical protein